MEIIFGPPEKKDNHKNDIGKWVIIKNTEKTSSGKIYEIRGEFIILKPYVSQKLDCNGDLTYKLDYQREEKIGFWKAGIIEYHNKKNIENLVKFLNKKPEDKPKQNSQ
jgi:hypothetical protein